MKDHYANHPWYFPLGMEHNALESDTRYDNRYLKIAINYRKISCPEILERAVLRFITSEHEYPMRIQAISEFGFLTLMKKTYFDDHDL